MKGWTKVEISSSDKLSLILDGTSLSRMSNIISLAEFSVYIVMQDLDWEQLEFIGISSHVVPMYQRPVDPLFLFLLGHTHFGVS
jgi:hypothetical protein